ncbi:S49 family peptidase [Frankia sp. CN6]|uniref:S49 family peptidase n=1 Tax=Frankia nepalensis TaxID=1836974 RepID=A0A937UQ46_9ACTN|nr:S49 family peptidase [Frankia nepalensis]
MDTSPRHALAEIRALAARRNAPLILELDLTVDPVEGAADDPLAARLGRRRQSLREIVDGLRRAALDPRTRVLVAHVASCGMPIARAQEIREAVADLRAAGKFAIAYADTFGEFGGGTVPYYLACAFDQIWLAPPGDLGLTGVVSHTPFLRDALDRLGVKAELGARHEYKNAVNTFVERGFTSAHLEATTRVVESCADEIVAGIAAGRRLPADRVRLLVDAGPLAAAAALRAGLVDRLGYRDEVYEAARRRARGDAASTPAAGPEVPVPAAAAAPVVPTASVPTVSVSTASVPGAAPAPSVPTASAARAAAPEPGRLAPGRAEPAASEWTEAASPTTAAIAMTALTGAGTPAGADAAGAEPAGAEAAGAEAAGVEPAGVEPAGVEVVGAEAAGGAVVGGSSVGAEKTAPDPGTSRIGEADPGGTPAPVPMYLGAYRRSAERREASPLRRAARSSGATVGSLLGQDRRAGRRRPPAAPGARG